MKLNKGLIAISILALIWQSCTKKTDAIITNIKSSTSLNLYNSIKTPDGKIYICGGNDFAEHIILRADSSDLKFVTNNFPTSFNQALTNFSLSPSTQRMFTGGYASMGAFKNLTDTIWQYWQQPSYENITGIAQNSKHVFFCNNVIGGSSIFQYDNALTFISRKNFSHNLEDIAFVNDTMGIACGNGAIMLTKDGGISWNYTTAKGDFFNSIAIVNANTWIVAGLGGSILRTDDGGNTWHKIVGNKVNRAIRKIIYEPSTNEIMAVGDDGFCGVIDLGNEQLVKVKCFTFQDLYGAIFIKDKQWLVHGTEGIISLVQL